MAHGFTICLNPKPNEKRGEFLPIARFHTATIQEAWEIIAQAYELAGDQEAAARCRKRIPEYATTKKS